MYKDPTNFRKRFLAYKDGKMPYKNGRPIEDEEFESFRQTLPDNQKEPGDYRTRRYWELNDKPKTFGEAIGRGMYNLGDSGKYGQYGIEIPGWHANSVAYDKATGNYEFMKPNSHPTRWMEGVYGYWGSDMQDFRENYKLQKGPVYDKYVPKKNVYELPKFEGGKEPIDGGTPFGVVVTGRDRRPAWKRMYLNPRLGDTSLYYNPDNVVSGFNVLTLGGMNNLSPTLWARRAYDVRRLVNGSMSTSLYANRWINGNEGIVSANFEKNHPYISTAINSGADILTGAATNKLLLLNKFSRLQKMYTSVPKTADKVTGEAMPDLFRKGYSGTVWTSNNPDYGYFFTNGGETFDVYFDPKKLNLLDTPHAPKGTYFVWNRLPFKGRDGKLFINPKAEIDNTAFMYNTKDDVLANTDQFGVLAKSNDALHPFMEPRLMNKNTLGFKTGLKTDHVVRYSKTLSRDGAKFHNVYDGGAEDLRGFIYDTPLEEVVLNPGAEYFWTEHGAGRLGLLNQMPYKNLIPYMSTGTLSNLTNTQNELRNK